MWEKKPESWVEVVDASVMKFSDDLAGAIATKANNIMLASGMVSFFIV